MNSCFSKKRVLALLLSFTCLFSTFAVCQDSGEVQTGQPITFVISEEEIENVITDMKIGNFELLTSLANTIRERCQQSGHDIPDDEVTMFLLSLCLCSSGAAGYNQALERERLGLES